jgi:hypothetical protein
MRRKDHWIEGLKSEYSRKDKILTVIEIIGHQLVSGFLELNETGMKGSQFVTGT